jgi:outer membrane lipoprotein LolB
MSKRLVPLLLCLGVTACAHLRVGSDGYDFEQRRARLEAVEDWDMHGRLAVNTGSRAFQGSFEWRQRADTLSLLIRGPFGQGVVRVEGRPDHLTVSARGERWELSDPEPELSDLLGWWLPIASLHAWLIGLPDPRFEARRQLGPEGQLLSLRQRLWRLRYPSYQLEEGVLLPRRIDLSHQQLELRVVVDAWRQTSRTG